MLCGSSSTACSQLREEAGTHNHNDCNLSSSTLNDCNMTAATMIVIPLTTATMILSSLTAAKMIVTCLSKLLHSMTAIALESSEVFKIFVMSRSSSRYQGQRLHIQVKSSNLHAEMKSLIYLLKTLVCPSLKQLSTNGKVYHKHLNVVKLITAIYWCATKGPRAYRYFDVSMYLLNVQFLCQTVTIFVYQCDISSKRCTGTD